MLFYCFADLKKLIKYEAKRDTCHRDESRNFVQEILRGMSVEQAKHGSDVEKADVESTEKQKKPNEEPKENPKPMQKSPIVVPELKVSTPGGRTRVIKAASDSNKDHVTRPGSRGSYSTHTIEETQSEKDERVKMWIRTTDRPRSNLRHRNDPVELYHKYQQEWQRLKQFIPGENDHSELRWKIRTKLLTS